MNARPSSQAYRFEVTVAGKTCTQSNPQGLEFVQVEDHVDMIGVARLTFNLQQASWQGIEIGSDVEVSTGEGRKLFVGVVTGSRHAMKHGRETLTVVAMDPLLKASASRRTETYDNLTDADIVKKVIGRAGLSAGKVDATQETHAYVYQRNESDLEFMKRLAARNNYMLMANEGKVDFVKPQFGGTSIEITGDQIEDLDYQMNAAAVPPNLNVYGWDYVATDKVEGAAGSGDIESIGGGQNAVQAAARLWQEQSHVSDVFVDSQGKAKETAVAELNRIARNFLRGTAVLLGDSKVFAGVKLKFTGNKQGFNPEVFVISSRHVMEFKRGYTVEVHFCSNTMPE